MGCYHHGVTRDGIHPEWGNRPVDRKVDSKRSERARKGYCAGFSGGQLFPGEPLLVPMNRKENGAKRERQWMGTINL